MRVTMGRVGTDVAVDEIDRGFTGVDESRTGDDEDGDSVVVAVSVIDGVSNSAGRTRGVAWTLVISLARSQ